jgi:hypothetical protein
VDSSLLEEWERLKNPDFRPVERSEPLPPGAEEAARAAAWDVTADAKVFTAAIRARIFSFLSSLARHDIAGAFEALAEGSGEAGAGPLSGTAALAAALEGGEGAPWTEDRLRKALEDYRIDHGMFRLDAEGRSTAHTLVDAREAGIWRVEQMLQDHEGHNDGKAMFEADLSASRAVGAPVLRLITFG